MTHRNEHRRTPGRSGGAAAWILVGFLVLVTGTAGAAAGFGLARGAWTVPARLAALLPQPMAARLAKGTGSMADMPPDLDGFAFELVEPRLKSGDATVKVRLVRKSTAEPVADAVVFAPRLDMAPDGMATMKTKLEPQPSPDPGTYAFRTNLSMEGRWRLSLAAKVPGETGTVQDQLVFEAVE